MKASGLRQKARDVVVRVLMTQPRTIATPASLSFTRSLILRPRPLPSSSYAPPGCSASTTMSTSSYDPSLDALFKQKKILRARVKKDLKSMDPTLRSQEDDAIQKIILEAPWFKSCRRLCAYISCSALREVDTSKVLLEILQNPAQVSPYSHQVVLIRFEFEKQLSSHQRFLHVDVFDEFVTCNLGGYYMNRVPPVYVMLYFIYLHRMSYCPFSIEDSHSQAGKKLYVPLVEDKNRHMRMLHILSIDDLIANSMNILEPAPVDAYGNDREDGKFRLYDIEFTISIFTPNGRTCVSLLSDVAMTHKLLKLNAFCPSSQYLIEYISVVMLANDPVDMLLLPGLAFDKSGRRLGRGGGYYDTFLTNYQNLANERKWKQPLLIALSYSSQILDEDVIPVTPNDVFIDALVTASGVISIRSGALECLDSSV